MNPHELDFFLESSISKWPPGNKSNCPNPSNVSIDKERNVEPESKGKGIGRGYRNRTSKTTIALKEADATSRLLEDSVLSGDLQVTTLLLEKGVPISGKLQSALSRTKSDPAVHSLSKLQKWMLPLRERSGQNELTAALTNYPEMIKLLDKALTTEILLDALGAGHTDMAMSLMKHSNLEIRDRAGRTCLEIAIRRGAHKMVELLLKNKANVNQQTSHGWTVLHMAILQDDREMARVLLKYGADTESRGPDGIAALEKSVLAGNQGMVEVLLENGANINAKGKDNMTALEIAILNRNHEIADLLMTRGASVDGLLLHDAAWRGSIDLVRMLLAHGADVNARIPPRKTALETAVCNGDQEIVRLLVSAGADTPKKGQSGRSPFEIAASRGDNAMLDVLADRSPSAGATYLFEKNFGRHTSDTIICSWEVPGVLGNKMQTEGLLTNALTLTAKEGMVEVATCEDYMRRTYGDDGTRLLSVVIKALENPTGTYCKLCKYFVCRKILTVAAGDGRFIVEAEDDQVRLKSGAAPTASRALSWLCLAIRKPMEGAVSISTGYLDCANQKRLVLRELQKPAANETGCWYPLFETAVIAVEPSEKLLQNHFLNIDFNTMVQLSGVEYPVNQGSGLVLMGYSTALVPIKIRDDDTILWHVEVASHEDQLKIHELKAIQNTWLKTKDLGFLQSKRATLGWCSRAIALLGTNRLEPTVSWSNARPKPTQWHWRGANLQMTAQAAAPLQVGAQAGATFERTTNSIRYNPSSNYLRLLNTQSKQQVLLYDVKSHRAWMVPVVSVLLHMVVVYHHHIASDAPIPYAEPGFDGSKACLSILKQNGSHFVENKGDDFSTIRDLVMGFSANLSKISIHKPRMNRIYGFEFMDIVLNSPMSKLKKASIETGGSSWKGLLAHIPCLFCSDLGDAIVGMRATFPGVPCNKLPKDFDCMATTMRSINSISQQSGEDVDGGTRVLSGGWFWSVSGQPFHPCEHDPASKCNCWAEGRCFQQLVTKKRVSSSCNVPADGAIVFGSLVSRSTRS